MKHASHPEIIKRLKQASGHLMSVIAMIEAGRSCVDLAQQLQAVENAIHIAKRTLVQDHMEHCLADAVAESEMTGNRALVEFKTLAKYLCATQAPSIKYAIGSVSHPPAMIMPGTFTITTMEMAMATATR